MYRVFNVHKVSLQSKKKKFKWNDEQSQRGLFLFLSVLINILLPLYTSEHLNKNLITLFDTLLYGHHWQHKTHQDVSQFPAVFIVA